MTDTGSALARLAAKGWRAAAVEASRVAELAEELAARRHGRELDVGVCEAYAAYLQAETFDVPTGMRSLVVVANPQPQVEIIFQWRGRQRALTLPPTYRYRRPPIGTGSPMQRLWLPWGRPWGRRMLRER